MKCKKKMIGKTWKNGTKISFVIKHLFDCNTERFIDSTPFNFESYLHAVRFLSMCGENVHNMIKYCPESYIIVNVGDKSKRINDGTKILETIEELFAG